MSTPTAGVGQFPVDKAADREDEQVRGADLADFGEGETELLPDHGKHDIEHRGIHDRNGHSKPKDVRSARRYRGWKKISEFHCLTGTGEESG